jgi:hypothetical protein
MYSCTTKMSLCRAVGRHVCTSIRVANSKKPKWKITNDLKVLLLAALPSMVK